MAKAENLRISGSHSIYGGAGLQFCEWTEPEKKNPESFVRIGVSIFYWARRDRITTKNNHR